MSYVLYEDRVLLNEILFQDILRKSKDTKAPIAKVYDIKARFAGIAIDTFIITFYTQDFGPQGTRRIHTTQFQLSQRLDKKKWKTAQNLYLIKNNLPALRAFVLNGFIKHGQTNYWCSCESFLYGGFSFMAYKNKSYIDPHKETRFPKKTNPNLRGIICKHGCAMVANITQFTDVIIRALQLQLERWGQPGTLTTKDKTPELNSNDLKGTGTNKNTPDSEEPEDTNDTEQTDTTQTTDGTNVNSKQPKTTPTKIGTNINPKQPTNKKPTVPVKEKNPFDNAKQLKKKHKKKKHHWVTLHTDLNNLDIQKWLDNIYKKYHNVESADEKELDNSTISRIRHYHK